MLQKRHQPDSVQKGSVVVVAAVAVVEKSVYLGKVTLTMFHTHTFQRKTSSKTQDKKLSMLIEMTHKKHW